MLGGGALPPSTPPAGRLLAGEESRALRPFGRFLNHHWAGGATSPCWPAFGRREISSASPFGRFLHHHWEQIT